MAIELIGGLGLVLLLVFRFTGLKVAALWGQIFLILSFGLIAFLLIRAKVFWMGCAFAFATLAPLGRMIQTTMRRGK